jgi:hypothetical protein
LHQRASGYDDVKKFLHPPKWWQFSIVVITVTLCALIRFAISAMSSRLHQNYVAVIDISAA